jgi:hypothetical protein
VAGTTPKKPKLLAGGNPQIPKGYGDPSVQAYIEAMPEWKSAAGRRLDEIVERALPDVRKAVKYNSPLYGAEGRDDWFLSFHCYERYVKVAFLNGASLDPPPPVESKQKEVRYLHLHKDDELDRDQLTAWVKQASQLPGESL